MPAGALRALLLTAFILCLSSLPVFNVLAQEESAAEQITESAADDSPLVPAPDRHAAAEQALPLGDDAPGTAMPAPASAFSIIRVILTLAVVAAAIYGLVFFIKRGSRGGAGQDPFLKILASVSLGANRGVHIISVGSKAWLVGAAEGGVNLIAEIEEKETLDAMVLENSRKSAAPGIGRFGDFKALLRRHGMAPDSIAPDPQEIRKRSERLKGL